MNNMPLVSVIIPTYKRPEKLSRAINSVLNQTYKNVEVIVVDDNNPDTEARCMTEKIMSAYEKNDRVRYIRHKQNRNGAAARNTGASYSNAKYIGLLDDDDEFFPDKIKSQVDRLEELGKEFKLCYSKYIIEKEGGGARYSSENREGNLYLEALTRELHICAGSNLLIEKKAFDSVGGFDESFIRNQDLELLTKLLVKYKIAYTSVVGVKVNFHTNHGYYDPVEITRQYYSKFSSIINGLNNAEKKRVEIIIRKQVFYETLIYKKQLLKALVMIVVGEISIISAFNIVVQKFFAHFKKTV